MSSASIPVSDKYYYFILYEKSKYQLENATITNGILSGKLSGEGARQIGNKVNLYLSADTGLIISTAGIVNLPVRDVSRVEIVKYSPGKTILLVAGTIIGVVAFIGALNFHIYPY